MQFGYYLNRIRWIRFRFYCLLAATKTIPTGCQRRNVAVFTKSFAKASEEWSQTPPPTSEGNAVAALCSSFLRGRQSILIETTIRANLISNGYARSRSPLFSSVVYFSLKGSTQLSPPAFWFFLQLWCKLIRYTFIAKSERHLEEGTSAIQLQRKVQEFACYRVGQKICFPKQSCFLTDGK